METLTCLSIKGGVSKTTTVVSVAGVLATEYGRRVLVVDLDPQSNATQGLGVDPYGLTSTAYDVLHGDPAEDAIVSTETPGVDLLPATLDLAAAELELAAQPAREMRLRRALESVASRYDFCLVDTPPSLSVFSQNAAMAARWILTPVEASAYSLGALGQLRRFLDVIAPYNPTGVEILGVVLVKVDARLRLTADMESRLREALGPLMFGTTIPLNVRAAESAAAGVPVNVYARTSTSAQAYRDLTREILTRLEVIHGQE